MLSKCYMKIEFVLITDRLFLFNPCNDIMRQNLHIRKMAFSLKTNKQLMCSKQKSMVKSQSLTLNSRAQKSAAIPYSKRINMLQATKLQADKFKQEISQIVSQKPKNPRASKLLQINKIPHKLYTFFQSSLPFNKFSTYCKEKQKHSQALKGCQKMQILQFSLDERLKSIEVEHSKFQDQMHNKSQVFTKNKVKIPRRTAFSNYQAKQGLSPDHKHAKQLKKPRMTTNVQILKIPIVEIFPESP